MSRAVNGYRARNDRRILLLGIDSAGKTTLLRSLSQLLEDSTPGAAAAAAAVPAAPTTQITVAMLHYGKLTFNLWDVGGSAPLRPYWRHYYTGTQGVVFILDPSDTARLDVAIAELQNVAADDLLVGVPIAVAVNARGAAAGAAAVADLTSRLEPSKLFAGRPWRLEACDASDARDAGLKRLVEFLAAETREI